MENGEHHVSVHVDRYEQTKNIRTARLRLYTRKVRICNLYQMCFSLNILMTFSVSVRVLILAILNQIRPSPPQLPSGLFVAGKNTEVRGGDLTFHGSLWQNFLTAKAARLMAKTPGFNMVKVGKSTPPTKENTISED